MDRYGGSSKGFVDALNRMADAGNTRAIIDVVGCMGYDRTREVMLLAPVVTYRHGLLHLGGDSGPNTVPLNNGQAIISPSSGLARAVVVHVDMRRPRMGRSYPVLAQYQIDDVFGRDRRVMAGEPERLRQGMGIALDVDRLGFVKTFRVGTQPFVSPRVQQHIERQARLTPEERAEFGFVAACLKAINLL